MANKTPAYEFHVAAGARMGEFSGWELPIHYGSQVEEHHAVRQDAGVFDVSHMTIVDLRGSGTRSYLSRLLANDIGRLTEAGQALYSCMLNADAGVLDDLIAYRLADGQYRLVVNAGTRRKDLEWLQAQALDQWVEIEERPGLAMLAVQGPRARPRVREALSLPPAVLEVAPFHALQTDEYFVARTGYTGEDGWEIMLPAELVTGVCEKLRDADLRFCGLGARDTLRLEAGLNLYGQDMDESVTPLECGLGWTVAWEPESREFNGRIALQQHREARPTVRQTGLIMEGRGIARAGCLVTTPAGEGVVTSGGWSPTMERSIALARVPAAAEAAAVNIRGRSVEARLVKPPFVRRGKILVEL